MENLTITKESAIKAYEAAGKNEKKLLENLLGKDVFAPKEVTERIKSFLDVLADMGITHEEWQSSCAGLTSDEIAYRQLVLIAQSLNEGWVPDWGNSNEYKYYPWFNMGGSAGSSFSFYDFVSDSSRSLVGSRLCYKSRKLAEYAAKQFIEIYKQFYLIQN